MVHTFPVAAVTFATVALAAASGGDAASPGRVTLLGIAMFFGQCSIGIQNDYLDRGRDAGRADKPIATGLVRPRAAAATWVVAATLFVALYARLGPITLALGIAAVTSGYAYNLWLKHTPFGALAYVAGFCLLALWVWSGTDALRPALLWIFVFGPPILIGLALANAIPDIEHDRRAGVRNLATLLGPAQAVRVMLLAAVFGIGTEVAAALWFAEVGALPALTAGIALGLLACIAFAAHRGYHRVAFRVYGVMAVVLAAGWVAAA